MSTPLSDDPSVTHSSATPTISAHERRVTRSGFLPNHRVAVRITCAGEDVDDGKLYIAATDHRPDHDGACGRLWSNTCGLVVAEAYSADANRAAVLLRGRIGALHHSLGSVRPPAPRPAAAPGTGIALSR